MLQTFQIVSHDIVENLNWGTKTLVITKTCLILSIIKEKLFLLVSNYDKLKVVSFLLTSLNRSNDMHLRKIIFTRWICYFWNKNVNFSSGVSVLKMLLKSAIVLSKIDSEMLFCIFKNYFFPQLKMLHYSIKPKTIAHSNNCCKTNYTCLHSQFEIEFKHWFPVRWPFEKGLIFVII